MQMLKGLLALGVREGPGRRLSFQDESWFFLPVEGGAGQPEGCTGCLEADLPGEELNPAGQSGPPLGGTGPSSSNSATFF